MKRGARRAGCVGGISQLRVDEVQEIRAPGLRFGRGNEDLGCGVELVQAGRGAEAGDAGLRLRVRLLVDFGENHREGNAALDDPLDEGQVDGLRFEARVDQNENGLQVFAMLDVVRGRLVEVRALRLGDVGVAIAGRSTSRQLRLIV